MERSRSWKATIDYDEKTKETMKKMVDDDVLRFIAYRKQETGSYIAFMVTHSQVRVHTLEKHLGKGHTFKPIVGAIYQDKEYLGLRKSLKQIGDEPRKKGSQVCVVGGRWLVGGCSILIQCVYWKEGVLTFTFQDIVDVKETKSVHMKKDKKRKIKREPKESDEEEEDTPPILLIGMYPRRGRWIREMKTLTLRHLIQMNPLLQTTWTGH